MMLPIASTIEKTITADAKLGRMCRNMTRSRPYPRARAASTYCCRLATTVWARMIRA